MALFVAALAACAGCGADVTVERAPAPPAQDAGPVAPEPLYCDGDRDCPQSTACADFWCWQLRPEDPPSERWGRCFVVAVEDGLSCGAGGRCERGECSGPE